MTPTTPSRAKTWTKRIVLALLVLLAVAAAALFAGSEMAHKRMQRTVDLKVAPVAFRDDAAALERGRYLYASRGCVDCHGEKGNGRTFVDDGKGLRIAGPNISPGAGSVVAGYQAQDWVRAIRHGVNPKGHVLLVMPSEDYNRFTDEDLASLVAHVRHLAPAEGGGPVLELPLPVRVAYGFGLMPEAYEKIDHARAPEKSVPDGVTLEHGAYVANMCLGCHGEKLAGGKIPGGPPEWPAAANLRPGEGSAMPRYADAQAFTQMFKTGKRPDGSAIQVMPFGSLREMSEVDVHALHLYLQSLPPLKKG